MVLYHFRCCDVFYACGYFPDRRQNSYRAETDEWLRHRIRAIYWKQWKKVKTRYRNLRALKLEEWQVHPLRVYPELALPSVPVKCVSQIFYPADMGYSRLGSVHF